MMTHKRAVQAFLVLATVVAAGVAFFPGTERNPGASIEAVLASVPQARSLLAGPGGFRRLPDGAFASDAPTPEGKDPTAVRSVAPTTLREAFSVSSPTSSVQVRAVRAAAVTGVLHERSVVYPEAFDGVDVVATTGPERFQLLYFIRSTAGLPPLDLAIDAARIEPEPGAESLLLSDEEGNVRFRLEEPVAFDARGVRRSGRYDLVPEGVRVEMNWTGLVPPVVLDPAVVVPVWTIESDGRTPGGVVYSDPRLSREVTLAMDTDRDVVVGIRPLRSQQFEDHLQFFGVLSRDTEIQAVASEPREPYYLPGLVTDLERQEWARTYSAQAETWRWSGAWSLSSATQLPGLIGATMAYDDARERMVAFGGVEPHWYCSAPTTAITRTSPYRCTAGSLLGQTYEFDGSDWTTRNHANPPPPRLRPSMVSYRGGVLLFGGRAIGSDGPDKWKTVLRYEALFPENLTRGLLNDTWLYDGSAWTRLPVANPPSARENAQLVLDERRQTAVLVGGSAATGAPDEFSLWEFDGTDWRNRIQQTSAGLPPAFQGRRGVAAFWHPVRRTVLLFGGIVDRFHFCPLSGSALTQQIQLAQTNPVLKLQLAEQGCLGGYSHDTWEWDGETLSQLTHVAFCGLDGNQPVFCQTTSPAWHADVDAPAPPTLGVGGVRRLLPWRYDQRDDHFALRTTLERAYVSSATTTAPTVQAVETTPPEATPPPGIVSPAFGARLRPQVAFSVAQNKLRIFSDREARAIETDGATWVDASTSSPFSGGAMDFYAATWDGANNSLILFDPRTAATWTYSGGSWHRASPTLSPPIWGVDPNVRQERDLEPTPAQVNSISTQKVSAKLEAVALQMPRMTLDRQRGVAVMVYGQALWEFDGTSWSSHPLPASWSTCTAATLLAYDGARQKTVAFGCKVPAETWEWDGTTWTGPGASPYQALVLRDKNTGMPEYDLPYRWSGTLQLGWIHPDAVFESSALGGVATTDADGTLRVWDGTQWSAGPAFEDGYVCRTATAMVDPDLNVLPALPLSAFETMGSLFDLAPMCFFPPMVEDAAHGRILAFRDGPRQTQELRLDVPAETRAWSPVVLSSNFHSGLINWSISPSPFELMSAEHAYLHTQTDPASRTYPPGSTPPVLPDQSYRVAERRVHNLWWPFRVLADPSTQTVRVLTNRGLLWQLHGDPMKGLGDSCTANQECGVGHCSVEGVCCDDAHCGEALCTTCRGTTPGRCETVPEGAPEPLGRCGDGECEGYCRIGAYENSCAFDPTRPCGPEPTCQNSVLVPGGHCYGFSDECALPNTGTACPIVNGVPDLAYTTSVPGIGVYACSLSTEDCGTLGCETPSACRTQCSDVSHCDDKNPCTVDSCDDGECSHVGTTGGACDDGNACTTGEVCADGVCSGTPRDCDDGNRCTLDSCDPASGCQLVPLAVGASCADANLCNGNELCDGAGTCRAGTPVAVADADPCTSDTCDPATGTVTHPLAPPGTACLADCQPGTCTAAGACEATGLAYQDDGDPCTLEFCDPATGAIATKRCAPLNRTVATNVLDSLAWMLSGDAPVQSGVAPDQIAIDRAAVVHGHVVTADGLPLANVKVTVAEHPEFGETRTRMDGKFTMLVNGGNRYSFDYQAPTFLSASRELDVVKGDSIHLPQIMLRRPDPSVTRVAFSDSAGPQLAVGSEIADAAGTRTGVLSVPGGTTATLSLPDGTEVTQESLGIHITEYSVGPTGASSFPAELPGGVANVYAVELDSDEAIAANARQTTFSKPLAYYVDNFLGLPAGTRIPWGSFNREERVWEAEPPAVVLDVVAESNGVAAVDVDGDAVAEELEDLELLGVAESELAEIASLYDPGQSIWRAEIGHFSTHAAMFTIELRRGAAPPAPLDNSRRDDVVCAAGNYSAMTCRGRVLMETVPVAGTPYSLNYTSERAPGRNLARVAKILVSGPTIPPDLVSMKVHATIAGKEFPKTFEPEPNKVHEIRWDGRDALGQEVQGYQPLHVSVEYTFSKTPLNLGDGKTALAPGYVLPNAQTYIDTLGWMDARPIGLGGWTLSVHHSYEPWSGLLRRGDGTVQSPRLIGSNKRVLFAGAANVVTPALDGSVYFINGGGGVSRWKDGQATNLAAVVIGSAYSFASPAPLAVDKRSRLYFPSPRGVARLEADGTISEFAELDGYLTGLAVDRNDNVYAAVDQVLGGRSTTVVVRIDRQGKRTNVLGGGTQVTCEDGSLGVGLDLDFRGAGSGTENVSGANRPIATDGDNLFAVVTDTYEEAFSRIIRVESDGTMTVLAGCDPAGESHCVEEFAPGQPAREAWIQATSDFAVAPDGSVFFIPDRFDGWWRLLRNEIWRITPAGILERVISQDGSFLAPVPMFSLGVSVLDRRQGRAGLVVSRWGGGLARLVPAHPELSPDEILLASTDGSEVYRFDGKGRHVATLHPLTGAVLLTFAYDGAGRLAAVTDAFGNETRVNRSQAGAPTGILAPFGQETRLTVGSSAFLGEVSNALQTFRFRYVGDGGLLSRFEDPRTTAHVAKYDDDGNLESNEIVPGKEVSLDYSEDVVSGTQTAVVTSPEERRTTFTMTSTGPDVDKVSVTASNGAVTTIDGDATKSSASDSTGTSAGATYKEDPRFGAGVPVSTSTVVAGSHTQRTSVTREATLSDETDPFSFETLTESVNVNGRTTVTVFTRATGLMETTTPAGRKTKVWVDSYGRPKKVEAGTLASVGYEYYPDGRLRSTTRLARSTSQTFTGAYLTSTTSPAGESTFVPDVLGRVLSASRAGASVLLGWDPNGNMTSVTPPGGGLHTTSYTPANLPDTYIAPSVDGQTPTESLYYNDDAQVVGGRLASGDEVMVTYDTGGRVDFVSMPGETVDYAYYPNDCGALSGCTPGLLTSLASTNSETVGLGFTYDGPLPAGVYWAGAAMGSVAWRYDDDFRIVEESVSVPGSATAASHLNFGYDLDGLVSCMGTTACDETSEEGDTLTFTYRTDVPLLEGTEIGAVSDAYAFNDYGELAGYRVTAPGSVYTATYDTEESPRDGLGRIVSRTETLRGVTHAYNYSYDAFGHLQTVRRDGVVVEDYRSTASGNRTSACIRDYGCTPETGIGAVVGVYNAQDQLVSYGTRTFRYTPNGELLTKSDSSTQEVTEYTHNPAGQLTQVGLPDGRRVGYEYDALGNRVVRKVDGQVTNRWLYRGAQLVAELDSAGSVTWQFGYASRVHVPDLAIHVPTGRQYRLITDHLGSPLMVLNTADPSDVLQEARYGTFGEREVLHGEASDLPFGFAGGTQDPDTGLVHFGARDYDPETGRWLQKDPAKFGGGMNFYNYAAGDPVNLVDPDGEHPVVALVLISVSVMVAGIGGDTYSENSGSEVLFTIGSFMMGVRGGAGPRAGGGISASVTGNPAAIARGLGSLNSRQAALLEALPGAGSQTIVGKSAASLKDLSALTAATGDEFAMFTTGGRRLIVRGAADSVPIGVAEARGLAAQGWRWSAHTHPGMGAAVLRSSIGDRAVLGAFGARQSAILNSVGRRSLFGVGEDLLTGWVP